MTWPWPPRSSRPICLYHPERPPGYAEGRQLVHKIAPPHPNIEAKAQSDADASKRASRPTTDCPLPEVLAGRFGRLLLGWCPLADRRLGGEAAATLPEEVRAARLLPFDEDESDLALLNMLHGGPQLILA